MSTIGPDAWTRRYKEALEQGVIKQRAETLGKVVRGLIDCEIEVACRRIQLGLEEINLITVQAQSIIRCEIERALAHAEFVYTTPHAALRAAYGGVQIEYAHMPTFITGLAGVGKTRVRLSLLRVLGGTESIAVDEAHPHTPLIAYADCVIAQQSSVLEALKPLANPEIASGRVKIKQGDLPAECARWQRVCGTCLLGVDEMQFMAQSETASTLITRTLLALADIGLPWFVIANYSLLWKLMDRPSEAVQRLLSRPVVVLPDPPGSEDWAALLFEFQVVLNDVLDFKLLDLRVELWNLCAGLKRSLVQLLIHAYRLSRHSNSLKVTWIHVDNAFESYEFSASRRDINLLIAHAGQGGQLRQDLKCPFEGPALTSRGSAFSAQLRAARETAVGNASIESAMTAEEQHAIKAIKQAAQPVTKPTAKVVPLPKPKPRGLDQLMQAGRDMRGLLGRDPQA